MSQDANGLDTTKMLSRHREFGPWYYEPNKAHNGTGDHTQHYHMMCTYVLDVIHGSKRCCTFKMHPLGSPLWMTFTCLMHGRHVASLHQEAPGPGYFNSLEASNLILLGHKASVLKWVSVCTLTWT